MLVLAWANLSPGGYDYLPSRPIPDLSVFVLEYLVSSGGVVGVAGRLNANYPISVHCHNIYEVKEVLPDLGVGVPLFHNPAVKAEFSVVFKGSLGRRCFCHVYSLLLGSLSYNH